MSQRVKAILEALERRGAEEVEDSPLVDSVVVAGAEMEAAGRHVEVSHFKMPDGKEVLVVDETVFAESALFGTRGLLVRYRGKK